MGLVSHANTMPWPLHPSFFITLFAYLLDAAALLIAAGIIYALMRGMLTLGDDLVQPRDAGADAGKASPSVPFTHNRKFPMSIDYREGSQHEA